MMKFWLKVFWKLSYLLSCSIYLHNFSKYLESVAYMTYADGENSRCHQEICSIHFKYETTTFFNLNVMCTTNDGRVNFTPKKTEEKNEPKLLNVWTAET